MAVEPIAISDTLPPLMPGRIPLATKQQYTTLRRGGMTRKEAAKTVGVSYGWATSVDKYLATKGTEDWTRQREARELPPGPITKDKLKPEALRAIDDFEYFRKRYFGHISRPWHIEAAETMVELLASPHKEFIVINCPPGSGKTVLFSHDIPAWLTVRDRTLRGLIGSHNQKTASAYTGRLRRTMERIHPVQAKDRDLQLGLAVDAESTLAQDFGPFRPDNPDIWTREQFTVLQFNEHLTAEKEATWTAFGQDASHIGWRVDYIVWDDVVTKAKLRTIESIETQQSWWDDEAETRLEPNGVLVLQGQRLAANDLYRYCLDKEIIPDDEDVEEDDTAIRRERQYGHIIYKAHYEEKCEKVHKPSEALAYPDGCLLDPQRLTWRELRGKMMNRQNFEVVYQQQDVDPDDVLVPKLWIDGGRGADGVEYPGCWDRDRDAWQIGDLAPPVYAVVTCDPSPTRYWSIQFWLYHQPTEQRFLMDHERRAMDAPDFLDYDPSTGDYTGLLEDWWHMSTTINHPFRWLIVEDNAAQRFMLQYRHFKQWAAMRKVNIIPHSTHRNKLDEKFGVVASLKPAYRYGRVRFPGKPGSIGRLHSLNIVNEATKWPGSPTDDCIMAQWFFEYHIPRITVPDRSKMPKAWRPSWMKASA